MLRPVSLNDAVCDNAAQVRTTGKPIAVFAQVSQANPQGGEIDRLRQALQVNSQRSRICSGGRAMDRIHSADHDDGAGELRIGDRLQNLHTVAVAQHQIQRHTIEPPVAELRKRLRT